MKDEFKAIGSYSTLGIEIVLCILAGLFGGRWVDARLGTAPYLSLVGFAFGIGAAAKAVLRALRDMHAITAREQRERGNPPPAFDEPSPGDSEVHSASSQERRTSPLGAL